LTWGTHLALTWAPGTPQRVTRAAEFPDSGRIDAETRAPGAMMVVMDDLEALARIGTAQLRALVINHDHHRTGRPVR